MLSVTRSTVSMPRHPDQGQTSVLDALDGVAGEFDVPPSLVAQEYNSICQAMNPQQHDHDRP